MAARARRELGLHPAHRRAAWTAGPPSQIGFVRYTEEVLAGRTIRLRVRVRSFVAHRSIELDTIGWLKVVVPGCALTIASTPTGCLLTSTLRLRCGWLLRRLGGRLLEAVRAHMQEEGESLRTVLAGTARRG